jgi:rubrerythrin
MKHIKHGIHRIRGWLTKEDIELLEEASKRHYKYPKNPAQKFKCSDCNYMWFYSSVKCPVCASDKTGKV